MGLLSSRDGKSTDISYYVQQGIRVKAHNYGECSQCPADDTSSMTALMQPATTLSHSGGYPGVPPAHVT